MIDALFNEGFFISVHAIPDKGNVYIITLVYILNTMQMLNKKKLCKYYASDSCTQLCILPLTHFMPFI